MNRYPVAYCTLQQFKNSIDSTATGDDDLRTDMIYEASAYLSGLCGSRVFEPYLESIAHDVNRSDPMMLFLRDDLLSLTSITDTAVIPAAGYRLRASRPPYYAVWRVNSFFQWNVTPIDAVTVVGVWGFNDNPDRMWKAAGTLTSGIDDAATSVTVTGLTGIETLSLIRIGSEYMRVVNVSGSTLTVERGVNGTEAAAHLAAAAITRYLVPDDVRRATVAIATHFYQTRDNAGERVAALDGAYEITKLLPAFVGHTIVNRRKTRLSSIDGTVL